MYISDGQVVFQGRDKKFVEKFGTEAAEEMVLDYMSRNSTPFVFDVTQFFCTFETRRADIPELLRDPDSEYRLTKIPKKRGGYRTLAVPSERLKDVQRTILYRFLSMIPISPCARAYYRGASLADNAAPHICKRYVLKLDVADFFDSITFIQVLRAAFNTSRCPKQIGFMLTKLCCYNEALPQGAPTSPALSNIVMRAFDDNLGGWCLRHGISYTRYCDDMTFSGDTPLGFIVPKVRGMLEEMGMELNEEKMRLISRASRQTVTGLTVNDGVRVPRDYKRELRKEVYYVLKYGVNGHLFHVTGKWDRSVGKMYAKNQKRYIRTLIGKCCYVLQYEPDNEWFKDAVKRLDKRV